MTQSDINILDKLKKNVCVTSLKAVSVYRSDKTQFLVDDFNENDVVIHNSIYENRQEIGAIISVKTKFSEECATQRVYPDTHVFPQGEMRCIRIAICSENDVVSAFDSYTTCAMTLDGSFYICANTLEEAFKQFEIANLIASICINVKKLGKNLATLEEKHIALYKLNVTLPLMEVLEKNLIAGENEGREQLCSAISTLYNEGLFLDSNGAASAKLSDDAFLITDSNKSRSSVTVDDIVLINNGRREAGKYPSNSAALHKLIYENNDWVRSIIISHPRMSMAYSACATDIDLDDRAKAIVGKVLRYPFGTTVMQSKLFSESISEGIRAYLIENDCLICLGKTTEEAVKITQEVERCASGL